VTETVVIKTNKNTYIQAVFEKNQTSGVVKNVGEKVIQVQPVQGETILPQTSTTTISQTKFSQTVKTNQLLQNITAEIIKFKPVYQNQIPQTT